MRSTSVRAGLCAATLALLSATAGAQSSDARAGYKAQVLRTSYGIPHVSATDWGSLGYGYGYAFAQDNVCVLAREVLVAAGTQSRWFGPGTSGGNFNADRVYKMVNSAARVDAAWSALDHDTRELLAGYAAGYNRYLRDTPASALPADCRSQPWVQPITGRDALRVLRKLLVRAGTGNFIAGLVVAAPPPLVGAAGPGNAPAARLATDLAPGLDVDLDTLPDFSVERFGSNAVALGSDYTRGAGALLGNPHFPWFGIERFYPVHLTIPGRYDVMGASIYGFPLVNIGFNRDLAWSHTVSTARRFVLRQLALVPGRPTTYLYGGVAHEMTPEIVSVEVREPDGTLTTRNHTFWMTRFGPVVVPAAGAGWTATQAFALTDVNLENIRAFVQYREMGQARNLEEFRAVLDRHAGLPWVNTIAADRAGNAYYGDVGAMPNASNAKLLACIRPGVAQALALARVYALDGSTPACDLGTDADAPEPGIFGASSMPSLLRRDFAQNSNDSYWLANPAAPLEGYSQIIGTDERRPQNFRTRLGITQIRNRAAGVDGLPGSGFDRQWLQDVLYGNRHYSAEILLDDVLGLCATQDPNVTLPVGTVNVAAACEVLARWDRRNLVDSVGAHVWTEFTRRTVPTNAGAPPAPGAGLPALTSAAFYRVPFDATDPVNTPSGIATGNPTVVSRVMGELAYTVKFFADNGIPLDRPWGAVQFDLRNGERIPIHGGSGVSGVYNAIAPGPVVPTAGFTPILAGSSWIQSVTFTPSGPEARAIATYSLSTDPASPHFADMTRLYSGYGWVALPFAERDIRRDPGLKVTRISERLR